MAFISNIRDHNNDIIYPTTKSEAIDDRYDHFVMKDSKQDIWGEKSFGNQMYMMGHPLMERIRPVPGNDIGLITESGMYVYYANCKNMPYTTNAVGYVVATFMDPDHGVIKAPLDGFIWKKWDGKWQPCYTDKFMTLWAGAAGEGGWINFGGNFNDYRLLRATFGTPYGLKSAVVGLNGDDKWHQLYFASSALNNQDNHQDDEIVTTEYVLESPSNNGHSMRVAATNTVYGANRKWHTTRQIYRIEGILGDDIWNR